MDLESIKMIEGGGSNESRTNALACKREDNKDTNF